MPDCAQRGLDGQSSPAHTEPNFLRPRMASATPPSRGARQTGHGCPTYNSETARELDAYALP